MRTGIIRCTGGPMDGRDVEVDGHPGPDGQASGVVTRGAYYLAVVDSRPVTADDSSVYDLHPEWVRYARAAVQPEDGPPVYESQ